MDLGEPVGEASAAPAGRLCALPDTFSPQRWALPASWASRALANRAGTMRATSEAHGPPLVSWWDPSWAALTQHSWRSWMGRMVAQPCLNL